MPISYKNYPKDWAQIRGSILERAGGCCEFCGIANYAKKGKTKIVITIAHLDHNPLNNKPGNLKALCQKCHLAYDLGHHRSNAAKTRERKRAGDSPDLFKIIKDQTEKNKKEGNE